MGCLAEGCAKARERTLIIVALVDHHFVAQGAVPCERAVGADKDLRQARKAPQGIENQRFAPPHHKPLILTTHAPAGPARKHNPRYRQNAPTHLTSRRFIPAPSVFRPGPA
jgi:hypothetical protein